MVEKTVIRFGRNVAEQIPLQRKTLSVWSRVARWHIFKTKIQIWVNLLAMEDVGIFMAIWSILVQPQFVERHFVEPQFVELQFVELIIKKTLRRTTFRRTPVRRMGQFVELLQHRTPVKNRTYYT
jgi:hypothetical protein